MAKEKIVELEVIEVTEELIKAKTYVIRGRKVMLDFDLAAIYGYETKRFNEQVNNIERFIDDFMFKLTENYSSPKRRTLVTLVMS